MLSQSACTWLHQTVNIVVFLTKNNGNTCPKGRALMQMYRVMSSNKEGIYSLQSSPTIGWVEVKWILTDKTTLDQQKVVLIEEWS